jgi:hypothetical protein
MKNVLKISGLFVLTLMILASCSKDQKCVNWLEGGWDVTGAVLIDSTGTETDIFALATSFGGSAEGTFTFEKYSVKKEENGTAELILSTTIFGQTEADTTNFEYRIEDDCTTVWLRDVDSSEENDANIEESSKTKFVVLVQEESDNSQVRLTIEKPE